MKTNEHQGKGIFRTFRTFFDNNRLGDILVLTGKITSAQLREALALQKQSGLPLGRVLVRHSYIRQRDLYTALFAQRSVRSLAGFVAVFVALSTFGPKSAKADNLSGQFQLASARADIGQLSSYPTLFGSNEKGSADTAAFTKWSGMFARFEHDLSDPANAKVMSHWKDELSSLRGLPLEDMAVKVNSIMNQVRYARDNRLYGKSDYWATPVEFMENGGDCEDYAIAKYVSLRALGVPENRLRIAVVHDRQQNTPHAVLIVYTENKALVLDNQNRSVKDSSEIHHYKPIFSLNRSGWWLHQAPSATQIASR